MNSTGLLLATLLLGGGARELRHLGRRLEGWIAAHAGGASAGDVANLQHLLERELFADREGSQELVSALMLMAVQGAGQAPATTTTTPTASAPTDNSALMMMIAFMMAMPR